MEFVFEILNKNHLPDVTKIVGECFHRFEPMICSQKMSLNEVEAFVAKLLECSLPQELTVVAKEAHSVKISGAVITEELATENFPTKSLDMDKWGPVLGVVDVLDDFYLENLTLSYGRIAHLFMIGGE